VKGLVAVDDLFGMKFAASHPIAVNLATITKGRQTSRGPENKIGMSVEMTRGERIIPGVEAVNA
jgi:hypothetical protein